MSLLESCWQALSELTAYEFTSSSGKGSKTHWQGEGEGRVSVERVTGDCCYLKEKGVFSASNGMELDSQNEWLWRKGLDSLILSHVRRGRDHPVLLFELKEDSEASLLVTASPHLCGKDAYEASVWLSDDGLCINWTIRGSIKDERLTYRYY